MGLEREPRQSAERSGVCGCRWLEILESVAFQVFPFQKDRKNSHNWVKNVCIKGNKHLAKAKLATQKKIEERGKHIRDTAYSGHNM